MIDPAKFCVRCGSQDHTRASANGDEFGFCDLCCKRRKPIPTTLLRYIDSLVGSLEQIEQQTAATWVAGVAKQGLAGTYDPEERS